MLNSLVQRKPHQRKTEHPNARLRRREALVGLLFLSPWMLGFVLLKLLPILTAFGYSFTNFNMLSPDTTAYIGLQNYARFLTDLRAWSTIIRSLGYFATTVPIEMLVALALAAIFTSGRLRAKGFWRPVIFMPSIIHATAIFLIWRGFVDPQNGWLNQLILVPLGLPALSGGRGNSSLLATIFAIWSIGPGFLIMYGAMQGVPRELYEAARVDGAGPLTRFLNITVPIISPAIFFSLVINLTSAFGGSVLLDRGFVFSQSLSPMEGLIANTMFRDFDLGYAATLAWVMFIVTMTITIVLFRSARSWVYFPEESGHETF